MREIPLTGGGVAIVDDADYARVASYRWRLLRRRTARTQYAYRRPLVGGKRVMLYLHRFVLDIPHGGSRIDHRNGNGLDCRRENLRVASASQNGANTRRPKASTGIKNVYAVGDQFRPYATIKGRRINLGRFTKLVEAAYAAHVASVVLFGAFARCNAWSVDRLSVETKARIAGLVRARLGTSAG